MTQPGIDRLAIVIVYKWQAKGLAETLTEHNLDATIVNATGGLLQEGMVTMAVGTAHKRLPTLFSLIRDTCPGSTRYIPYDAQMEFPWQPECEIAVVRAGGATVFVVPIEQFVQL